MTWLEVFVILLFKLLHGEYMNEYPWMFSIIDGSYKIVMMVICLSMTLLVFDIRLLCKQLAIVSILVFMLSFAYRMFKIYYV